MVVRLIPLNSVPKATRNRTSRIKLSPEWREALTNLQSIRKDNALRIEFSPATLKLGKVTAQRFKRLLVRELEQMGLEGLKTFFRGKDSRGQPVLFVVRDE